MVMFNEKWYHGILERKSRRNFQKKKIEKEKNEKLNLLINNINAEDNNLKVKLIHEENNNIFKSITGLNKIYCPAYIAFIGNKNDSNIEEKIGYYGELVILEATSLGLGTCWMTGTFNKKMANRKLTDNLEQKVYAMTPLGYTLPNLSLNEKLIDNIIKKKEKKTIDNIYKNDNMDILSEWVIEGLRCVRLAPSSLDRQPWEINVKSNRTVYISIEKKYKNKAFTKIDCGIAMAHFEIGAMEEKIKGKWSINNGTGEFAIKKE